MIFKKTFYFNLIQAATTFMLSSVALAQEGQGLVQPGADLPPPSFASSFAEMMPMFAIVFAIFYFMVVKPQQNKLRQQEELIKNLSKGNTVLTSSGIIGRVAGIEKDHILLELATNVKVRFQPSHIVKSLEPSGEKEVEKGKAA
jgi:preprotein translocase subunit YajC